MTPPKLPTPARAASQTATLLIRMLMVSLIVGSFLLLWWTLNRLTLVQKSAAQVNAEIGRLSEEVAASEAKLAAGDPGAIEASLKQAESSLLDAPEDAVRWLQVVDGKAASLDLDVKMEVGEAAPTEIDPGLLTLPVTLNIRPRFGDTTVRSSYERVLDFGNQLASLGTRTDLVEFGLTAGTNSVEHASARVQLWVKLEDK